jgi:uncharacterized protein
MSETLESRINGIIKQFSLPKPEEDDFVKKTIELLQINQIDSLNDEELFKIILSSFNLFFFCPITSIDVQFTEACNLRCNYCFIQEKRANRFTAEMGKRALDFMVMNSGSVDRLNYTFFGGEPLLEFDNMYEVLKYSEEVSRTTGKKIAFNATTNGILLTEDILKKSQGKLTYLLSIDGDEETHNKHRITKSGEGSFRNVFSKIALIKKFQRWAGARMTVCPDTISDLYHNVDFLYRNGINQFIVGPSIEMNWDEHALQVYEEQFRKLGEYHMAKTANGEPFRMTFFEKDPSELDCMNGVWGCWAGRNHVIITYNGDIYPCSKFIGLESYNCPEFNLGNIFEGITNLSAREKLFNMKGHLFKACQNCPEIDSCSGGCPADNYSVNRNLFVPCGTGCSMTEINNRVLKEFLEKKKIAEETKGIIVSVPLK